MLMSPFFKASYRKLVFPKFGFTSTFSFVFSSIRSLYIFARISGSGPNLPAIINVCCPIEGIIPETNDAPSPANRTIKVAKIVFNLACSIHFNNVLNAIARSAEEIAPIKIKLALLRSIPRRMNEPSPPAPINAARVAVPIIKTAEVRTPDMITGMAIGISNFFRRSHFVIPKAMAASSKLGSIPSSPVIVFCKIGNNA